jgi:hypothetical protein
MSEGGFLFSIVAHITIRQLAFFRSKTDRQGTDAALPRINVDECQLIRRASCVGKHHADNLRPFNATSRKTNERRWRAFFAALRREKNKMDGYRVMQVGPDFIVFAGDVGVLKCQTEKDARSTAQPLR